MVETTSHTAKNGSTTNILVIGGGPGGVPAAIALAQAGKQVVLVEAGEGLGGTCLFKGCIPSKIFRETAYRRAEAARGTEFGLALPAVPPDVDWTAVQARRRHILNMRSKAALMHARELDGLEIVFGRARLIGPRDALIETPGSAPRKLSFEKAILATGSVPSPLPIPGADLPGVLDSDRLIGIGFVPRSLALIGGGPIGIEMAQIFSMLGSEVTVLEAAPRILEPVDAKLANILAEHLSASGVRLETDVHVSSIEGEENSHNVHVKRGGEDFTITAQTVAIVAGRHPAVGGLGLENTAVQYDRHGVKVTAELETNEPGIFATGDLVGHPMFAHWATAQALAVAQHILGLPALFPRPEHNSAVIFSSPEIGMAGLTEEAARAAGEAIAVAEYDYSVDARAQISANSLGLLRIVYRKNDQRVLGVHVLAEGAADLMGEAALAVHNGATLDQIAASIHPHPTLTEAFGVAARSATTHSKFRENAPPQRLQS